MRRSNRPGCRSLVVLVAGAIVFGAAADLPAQTLHHPQHYHNYWPQSPHHVGQGYGFGHRHGQTFGRQHGHAFGGGLGYGWSGGGVFLDLTPMVYGNYRWETRAALYDAYAPWCGVDRGPWYGFPHGYPYGAYYRPNDGFIEYDLPPWAAPAELQYGPPAVKQFLGVDRNFAWGPLAGQGAQPPAAAPNANIQPQAASAPPAVLPPVRETNADAHRRARTFIERGDREFAQQKYGMALERYKSAVTSAPDVAEGHLRKGFAYAATGYYDKASAAFQQALRIDPKLASSDFRLGALYDGAELAKQAHFETLARAALADERNGELLFVLGVLLHFDGQVERAAPFFARAREMLAAAPPEVAQRAPPAAPPRDL